MTDHAGRIRAAAAAFKAANHSLIADLDALDEATAARPPTDGGPFGILNLYQCAEFIGAHAGRHRGQVQRCLTAREASAR